MKTSKKINYFLTAFLFSFLFFWGVNYLQKNLENFFFFQKAKTLQPLLAQTSQGLEEELRSLRNWGIGDPEIQAKAVISVLITPEGDSKVLFKKNTDEKLPIASLVKLMTAYVVLEHYDLFHKVEISEQAILQIGDAGKLKAGQKMPVKYLLFPLLIESSNDAAYALAEIIGEEKFIFLMNSEAKRLGLKNTYFVNPTGLDEKEINNYSTVNDLAKFTKYLLNFNKNNRDELLWNILSTKEINLYGQTLVNTNQLLTKIPGIIGGRTGWTSRAGGSLLLVLQVPEGYLINIILGTPTPESRFEAMEKLTTWLNKAYTF